MSGCQWNARFFRSTPALPACRSAEPAASLLAANLGSRNKAPHAIALHCCSLFPAPKPLSAFYLSAYLDSLRDQGYTVREEPGALLVGHCLACTSFACATRATRYVRSRGHCLLGAALHAPSSPSPYPNEPSVSLPCPAV